MTELNYPRTDKFEVIGTIGIPHPYCIGTKHVAYASEHFAGMLTKDAIVEAERNGAKCCTCKGKLSHEEHKQALLIERYTRTKRISIENKRTS